MEETRIQYNHSLPIQIRFNDVDSFGHVNNTVYLSFYDLGKTDYFRAVLGKNVDKTFDLIIAHIDVDFLAPVFMNDEIIVDTAVTHIGQKSLTLTQRIICKKSNTIKCIANTVMVAYDFEKKCSKNISDEYRNAIGSFEKRPDFLSVNAVI